MNTVLSQFHPQYISIICTSLIRYFHPPISVSALQVDMFQDIFNTRGAAVIARFLPLPERFFQTFVIWHYSFRALGFCYQGVRWLVRKFIAMFIKVTLESNRSQYPHISPNSILFSFKQRLDLPRRLFVWGFLSIK